MNAKHFQFLARGEFPKNFWDYNINPITGEKKESKTKKKTDNNQKNLKPWS